MNKYIKKHVNKKRGSDLLSEPLSSVLGYPDSNQKRQDQNLQCYHYTIPQCACLLPDCICRFQVVNLFIS